MSMKYSILTVALVVSLSASQFAQAASIRRAGPDKVKNQYIVVLNDDVLPAQVPALAKQLASAHGAQLKKVWSSAIKGFFAIMPEGKAEAMSHNPHVKYVEENARMYLSSTMTMKTNVDPSSCNPTVTTCAAMKDNRLWHLDRADQNYADPNNSYSYCTTGSGVTVYVVDTGVVGSHAELSGRVEPGYNASGDHMPANDPCLGFALPPTGMYSEFEEGFFFREWTGAGHGTAVASAVAGTRVGVAKNATIVPVKTSRCDYDSARFRIPSRYYVQNETMFIMDGTGHFRGLYRAVTDGVTAATTDSGDLWPLGTMHKVDGGVEWEYIPPDESDESHSQTVQMIIDGLDWILSPDNHGPKSHAVVTLSTYRRAIDVGVATPPSDRANSLEDAIRNLLANDMTVIASANNQNGNACDYSPARLSRGNPDAAVRNDVITVGGTMILNRPWTANLTDPPTVGSGATLAAGGTKGPEPAHDSTKGVRDARWICGPGDSSDCSNTTPTETIDAANAGYAGFNAGSNAGSCVTLFAPAKNLFLARNTGPNDYRDARIAKGYASGTSWSAPIVAGFAARILEENRSATPEDVYDIMMENVSEGVLDGATLNTRDTNGVEIIGTPNKLLRLNDVNITAPPQSTTIASSGPTTFSVGASGTAAVSYQWYQVNSGFDFATYPRGANSENSSTPIGTNSNTLQVTPTARTAYWVRVSNSCGSADSDIVLATPAPDSLPTASFTVACSFATCTFNSSASSDDHFIASRSWSFGDGTTGTGTIVSHTYGSAGSYTVQLTVTDSIGQTGTQTHTATAAAPPIATNVGASASGTTVTITWTPSSGADSYRIERKVSSGSWQLATIVNGGAQTTATDVPTSASGVVVYHVVARAGTILSGPSNNDVAWVGIFSNDPLTSPPLIPTKAEHITEIRRAVNGFLDLAGATAVYSAAEVDPNNLRGQAVDDANVVTLMQNLNTARANFGLPSVAFRTPPTGTNVAINRTQIEDLRLGVK